MHICKYYYTGRVKSELQTNKADLSSPRIHLIGAAHFRYSRLTWRERVPDSPSHCSIILESRNSSPLIHHRYMRFNLYLRFRDSIFSVQFVAKQTLSSAVGTRCHVLLRHQMISTGEFKLLNRVYLIIRQPCFS